MLLLAAAVAAMPLTAKPLSDTTQVFHLGEVTVFEHQDNFKTNYVSSDFIKSADMQRVSEALNWVPGLIVQETGGRSEAGFILRGISSADVPIYIDGVPMTAPYDGTVDLYRLPAGMLSRIDVSKSASSLLLGGNTLGPSINLVSRQPQRPLELHADVNTLWHSNLNIGGRWGKWFAQADLSYSNVGNFRLPHSYPTTSSYLDGHKRLNAKSRDFNLNAKAGYISNATDEYVVGYTLVRAEKHIPPYLGENGKAQFRIYPDWDKDELYFHSTTRVAPKLTLKSRLWYDTFKNTLDSYDDFTYSTQEGKQGWTSIYDDYALGANANLVWAMYDDNELRFGANYKYDVHRSHNVGEPTAKISEGIYSFVVEDEAKLNPQMSLTASLGWFARQGYKIEEYNKKTGISEMPNSHDGNINALAAFDYHPSANQHFRFSLSTASLFARMKDRYSYKLGKAIPNPELGTQKSSNLDATYEGRWRNLNWEVGAYYYFINDIIQEVTGVDESDSKIYQLQNRGKAQYRGFELGVGYNLSWLTANANYSYINQKNMDNKDLKFLNSPRNKFTAFLELRPIWQLRLQGRLLAQSKAYSSSDGSTSTAGFATIDASIARKVWKTDLKVGVLNAADRVYEYTEGYPMRGRTWYASVSFDLF